MLEIVRVAPGSIAAKHGMAPGDAVVTINNEPVRDIIDYRFLTAEERVSIKVKKASGDVREIVIDKRPDVGLGAEFETLKIRRCINRCIFCFVDQMPPGCRKTLYVKDDDFRASFLYGNYITLGNLSEEDWERIFRQRLSPLYISVHATDEGIRKFMLGNKRAPDVMKGLRRLAAGGIKTHAQLVLCPGINDGGHLIKSVNDLAGLFPAVSSIALVPVGLTSHRKGLFPLRLFTPMRAKAVLKDIMPLAERFKRRFGTRLMFPSDEFFVKAGLPFPPASFYEDYPQIENGVGMATRFIKEASSVRMPAGARYRKATVVTGASFSRSLKTVLIRLREIKGVDIRQATVKNGFFGPSVTVAGLLSGRDILNALKGRRLGEMIIIPSEALKEDEDVFIDGMTLPHLGEELRAPVYRAGSFGEAVSLMRS